MNKESIFRQLEQRIVGRPLTAEALGEFNAMAIADSLKQKRSILSHHLNNLHREQRVVKVNGRPVLFLPIAALRDHHRLAVRHGEYASLQALCAERQDSLAQVYRFCCAVPPARGKVSLRASSGVMRWNRAFYLPMRLLPCLTALSTRIIQSC